MTARFISFHKITKVVKSLVRQYQIIKIPFSFLHHQLKIQDVHLRFEDDSSNLEKPFSFGVCINNVSAQNPAKEMVSVHTNLSEKTLCFTASTIVQDNPPSLLVTKASSTVFLALENSSHSRKKFWNVYCHHACHHGTL